MPLPWTNVVLLPGADVKLPKGDDFRMQQSWTITFSDMAEPPKNDTSRTSGWLSMLMGLFYIPKVNPRQPTRLGVGESLSIPDHFPKSLKDIWDNPPMLYDSTVITVLLLNLPEDVARQRYHTLMKDLASRLESKPEIKIHAAGTIKSATGQAEGSYNEALLMRYSTMDDYSAARKAGWWEEMVQLHDLRDVMEESAEMLVQEIELPGKDVKIDQLKEFWDGWDFGNPFESPGEDFFG